MGPFSDGAGAASFLILAWMVSGIKGTEEDIVPAIKCQIVTKVGLQFDKQVLTFKGNKIENGDKIAKIPGLVSGSKIQLFEEDDVRPTKKASNKMMSVTVDVVDDDRPEAELTEELVQKFYKNMELNLQNDAPEEEMIIQLLLWLNLLLLWLNLNLLLLWLNLNLLLL